MSIVALSELLRDFLQLGFEFGPVLIDSFDFGAQGGELLSFCVTLLAQQLGRDQLWTDRARCSNCSSCAASVASNVFFLSNRSIFAWFC